MDLSRLISTDSTDSTDSSRVSTMESRPSLPNARRRTFEQYEKNSSVPYKRTPQPPLSPPAEEHPKCSLPSISILLEGADCALPAAKRHRPNPSQSSDHNGSRVFLPPTPPLHSDSGFSEGSHSPSASSSSSRSRSTSNGSAVTPSQSQTRLPPIATSLPTTSDRSIPSASYASPTRSMGSFSSPVEPPATGVHHQGRSQSTSFPAPNSIPAGHAPMISPGAPAWQHHHYFPPTSSAPYPQNHDRYVCRTCHKAFSRPSSLRIHSHSHTGEKPFRCTHVGCGKAFSVRSNMKRHERGCHTGRPVTATLV